MKVLVTDGLDKQALEMMKGAGLEVVEKKGLKPEELLEVIPEYDAIVVRSATKVKKEVIEKGKNLKLIARAGVGLDNVDKAAAEAHKIKVVNTPAATSISVAELALGMMFAAARQIVRGTIGLKEGRWEKSALKGIELHGKTLGIIGCGRIGCELASRAHSLGMKVLGCDQEGVCQMDKLEAHHIHFTTHLDQVLKESDFISLHIPKTPETANLISKDTIAKMKDGVILINCARGGVVNEHDLAEALKSGKVAAAAMDVFEMEPAAKDNPLFALENFIGTPHIGASTSEGQKRAGIQTAELVIENLKHMAVSK
ncbi:MAG: hydroxyacid dehydrogenase [Candidatus Eremiobacteraeota bacterium]|nr:hydroxyacid dehydrogenase [Candidatus Eremiobacteraeota bacterium]